MSESTLVLKNVKLLEMSCRGSVMISFLMFDCPYFIEGDEAEHLGSGDNDDEPREQEPLREQVRIKGQLDISPSFLWRFGGFSLF